MFCSNDEDRFIIVGQSQERRTLVVVHVYRSEGNVIRIVSARKATQETRPFAISSFVLIGYPIRISLAPSSRSITARKSGFTAKNGRFAMHTVWTQTDHFF
ncbi:MAG: BrnT family toxin [Proteobacteria bacterium]|nr:BrnT family toxin [Pseudomonadota bacterium]